MPRFEVTLEQTVTYFHKIVVECEDEQQINEAYYETCNLLNDCYRRV